MIQFNFHGEVAPDDVETAGKTEDGGKLGDPLAGGQGRRGDQLVLHRNGQRVHKGNLFAT